MKHDLLGQTFGSLTVLGFSHYTKAGAAYWHVRCVCGVEKTAHGYYMRNGRVNSCGCQKLINFTARMTKHGKYLSREYQTWNSMMGRCLNPTSQAFRHYGARGITICEKWKNFVGFYEDMGDRPDGMSLERIDNEKGYSPDNCRWATHQEQMKNTRRCIHITYNGQTKILKDWARSLGMSNGALRARMNKSDDPEIILRPVATKFRPVPERSRTLK